MNERVFSKRASHSKTNSLSLFLLGMEQHPICQKKSHNFRQKIITQRSWYQWLNKRKTHRTMTRRNEWTVLFGLFDFNWNDRRILSRQKRGCKVERNQTIETGTRSFGQRHRLSIYDNWIQIFFSSFNHKNQKKTNTIKIGSIFCRIRIFFRSTELNLFASSTKHFDIVVRYLLNCKQMFNYFVP